MEFDEVNLKPTFKILWGVPGFHHHFWTSVIHAATFSLCLLLFLYFLSGFDVSVKKTEKGDNYSQTVAKFHISLCLLFFLKNCVPYFNGKVSFQYIFPQNGSPHACRKWLIMFQQSDPSHFLPHSNVDEKQ